MVQLTQYPNLSIFNNDVKNVSSHSLQVSSDENINNIMVKPLLNIDIENITKTVTSPKNEQPFLNALTNSQKINPLLVALDEDELSNIINNLDFMQELSTNKVEKSLKKIIADESHQSTKMFSTIASLDDNELKQLSQILIPLLVMGEKTHDIMTERYNHDDVMLRSESIGSVENSHFSGMISNDILVELSHLLSKVRTMLDISDRQINAQFLKLKTQMVEKNAQATIDEGKMALKGALLGFVISFGITAAGGLLQAKNLQQQKNLMNNQELSQGANYHELSNILRTKSGIIDSGTRLSDNFSQVAVAANQMQLKELEALKIMEQDVGETARSIAGDKEKQIETMLDLVKRMFEILRNLVEGQQRTLQVIATRG
ncbi:membrane protein [Providencia sneebia]|uniref:Membrane protein n=1 Tax=Providencia sneebia DSM 19967 TaxID=1141660 RepID=K8WLS9_9GAMM|nr:membrane protein [Providencia sneebia]EKT60901.1 membrane protein [Providencia sneebia DSM 19967]